MNGNPVVRQSPMSALKDGLTAYLAAVRALQSDDAGIRRPAISVLLELARQGQGTVRTNAERALTQEFGPYAVSEGLAGCSAPIETVNVCDGNCRSCVWLWQDQPTPSLQSSVMPGDLGPQPEASVGCPPYKAVA